MDLCYKLSCSLHLVSIDIHGSLVSTGACLPHFCVHTSVCYVQRHTDTHNVYIIVVIIIIRTHPRNTWGLFIQEH